MGLLRDGGNCVSCQSSPFEMAENCNSTGHCHRVGVDSRELLRAGYIAQAHGLVRHGGVPRSGSDAALRK